MSVNNVTLKLSEANFIDVESEHIHSSKCIASLSGENVVICHKLIATIISHVLVRIIVQP